MHPGKNLDPDPILSRDGLTLLLHTPDNGRPILLNAAGETVSAWEIELLHWPATLETELRRGGYLPGRPIESEPWCNCAD